jgi:hypothetical protein
MTTTHFIIINMRHHLIIMIYYFIIMRKYYHCYEILLLHFVWHFFITISYSLTTIRFYFLIIKWGIYWYVLLSHYHEIISLLYFIILKVIYRSELTLQDFIWGFGGSGYIAFCVISNGPQEPSWPWSYGSWIYNNLYSGTYLIRYTKGPGKCVELYRMSEFSGFILVNRYTLGPYIFVGCHRMSKNSGVGLHRFHCISNQCLSLLKFWVRIPLMARCTRYNIMW